jgi:hypothetical protein
MSKRAKKIELGPDHPAWRGLDDDDWNGATLQNWLGGVRGRVVVLRPPEAARPNLLTDMMRALEHAFPSSATLVDATTMLTSVRGPSSPPDALLAGEAVPVRMEPEKVRGTAAWRETVRRLAEGPNTARERGILRRRRARLRRRGEDRLWEYKTFFQRVVEHHQKMSDLANGMLRRVTEKLDAENKRLAEQNDELMRRLSERGG